jgi:hypothetical protein
LRRLPRPFTGSFSIRHSRDWTIATAFVVHSIRAQRNADNLAARIADLGSSFHFARGPAHGQ